MTTEEEILKELGREFDELDNPIPIKNMFEVDDMDEINSDYEGGKNKRTKS